MQPEEPTVDVEARRNEERAVLERKHALEESNKARFKELLHKKVGKRIERGQLVLLKSEEEYWDARKRFWFESRTRLIGSLHDDEDACSWFISQFTNKDQLFCNFGDHALPPGTLVYFNLRTVNYERHVYHVVMEYSY